MELGIIGLGKIGGNISLQCVDKGISVVGKDIAEKFNLKEKGVKIVEVMELKQMDVTKVQDYGMQFVIKDIQMLFLLIQRVLVVIVFKITIMDTHFHLILDNCHNRNRLYV